MPRKKPPTGLELLKTISSGLRTAAIRPNIHGYKPMPKQTEFHSQNVKGRLFLGGNRSGKTVGGATEAIWWLTGKHPYMVTPPVPVRGRSVSVDFLNGVEKIVRPEVARWIPPSELLGGTWSTAYSKELRTLTLQNGSTLEFMSYDQDLDKFAGTSRHFIWFDEEPPKDIFQECGARLIDTGGSWWITMTPVEGMTWVYDDVYVAAKTDSNFHVVEVDMTDNSYLNTVEIDMFLSTLTEDERKARKSGKFVEIGGTIYKMFSPKNIVDAFMPDPTMMHFAMMDHGFNNPTAWLWGAADKDGRVYIYDEHYESGQIVSYHAGVVHRKNREHGRRPDYYVGDPSIRNSDPLTGTSVLIEYTNLDVPIILGNNDVHAGINRVATLLDGVGGVPSLYITRNCINLIQEMQRYRWSTWATSKQRNDKNLKEDPHKRNDHACDALRYGIASRPKQDNGTVVPVKLDHTGVPSSVSPYSRVDTGSRTQTVEASYDFNLGSDW